MVLQWLQPSLDAFFGPARAKDSDVPCADKADFGLKPPREIEMGMDMVSVIVHDEGSTGTHGT